MVDLYFLTPSRGNKYMLYVNDSKIIGVVFVGVFRHELRNVGRSEQA